MIFSQYDFMLHFYLSATRMVSTRTNVNTIVKHSKHFLEVLGCICHTWNSTIPPQYQLHRHSYLRGVTFGILVLVCIELLLHYNTLAHNVSSIHLWFTICVKQTVIPNTSFFKAVENYLVLILLLSI